MYTVIVVLTIAAAAYAGPPEAKRLTTENPFQMTADHHTILNTKSQQRALYVKYTETGAWFDPAEKTAELAFSGLDSDKSGKVQADDIAKIYWHPYLKIAQTKVVQTVKAGATDFAQTDLETYLGDKHVKITIAECNYLKSANGRTACLADQISKHTLHVPEDSDIVQFFNDVGGEGDKLTAAKALEKFKDPIFLEELGATVEGDQYGHVTLENFKDYMKQEIILYDFRDCWEKLEATTTKISYNKQCMIESVATYVTDDLTEMDISVVYRIIDTDENGEVNKAELEAFTGLTGDPVNKIMKLLDMSITTKEGQEPKIDYAEFRNYMTSPTVLYQAEAGCTAPKKTQHDEIHCLTTLVKNLLRDSHEPIRLVMPDVEQQLAYEFFDIDHSGKITTAELTKIQEHGGPQMHESAIIRFIDEFDRFDDDRDVDLEEFNEYADMPNMVYATADCLIAEIGVVSRGVCYLTEFVDTIDNYKFIDVDAWQSWFDEYSSTKWKITKEDTEAKTKVKELFIQELGQGGDDVSTFEFQWYNKQQELADRYEKKSIVNYHTGRAFTTYQVKGLHELLDTWIEKDLTEDDTWRIFKELDRNNDHEIIQSELGGATGVPELIAAMDKMESYGTDQGKVTFREFWLWVNKATAGVYFSPKIHFEQVCIEPKESTQEVPCCVEIIKDPVAKKLIVV